MKNIILRIGMTKYDFKQYEVAAIYGCSECNFSKILREELPEDFQIRMVDLLEKIRNGEKYDDSFIKKYKEQKRREAFIRRNELRAEMFADYISKIEQKKIDCILDEMQEQRLLGRGCL